MKNMFLVSILMAFTCAASAQSESDQMEITSQDMVTADYQVQCGNCNCPNPGAILKEGWYKVAAPSNYFAQYIKPKTNCDGSLESIKVWHKTNTSTPDTYTCEGNTCTFGTGSNCRTIKIQSETSYIFQYGSREPGTFNFM